jgi:hypothetical protein
VAALAASLAAASSTAAPAAALITNQATEPVMFEPV